MGPLSRDDAVRVALGLAPSTLRALIADGARAGIAPPFSKKNTEAFAMQPMLLRK